MKFLIPIMLIAIGALSHEGQAFEIFDKGIYGNDNRKLVEDLDPDLDQAAIGQASVVFAQIPKWRITEETNEFISVKTKSLGSGLNFCADQRFIDKPLVSSCTAFLVAPDLILTAGHCVKDKYECQKNYWVLDYDNESGFVSPSSSVMFKKDKVYSCTQILSWSENTKLDYALIKINKKIVDRAPLALRRVGKISDDDSLLIIGHPMGLPKIFANGAGVRSNNLTYTFLSNTDSFSGNSGSPVINTETNLVEGMLIRGDEDFKMDLDLGCNREVICMDKECRGETIQRSTVLPLKLIPKI